MDRQYNRSSLKPEDVARLKKLFDEGIQVLEEIADLNAGLSETIKAIGEELEIKPSQLKKAISVAHKNGLAEERDKLDEIEDLLDVVGRKNNS